MILLISMGILQFQLHANLKKGIYFNKNYLVCYWILTPIMFTSWQRLTQFHLYTHVRARAYTQQVKVSIKRVSTSHIPPASQPAALFVDQSRDNKSFYCRVVLPPVSLLFLHSLFLLLVLIQHTLISLKQLCFFSHFLKYISASVCNFSLPLSTTILFAISQLLSLQFPFLSLIFLPHHHHLCSHFSIAFPPSPFPVCNPPLISPTPPSHSAAVPVALVFTSPVVWCVGTSFSAATVSTPKSECECICDQVYVLSLAVCA